MATLLTVDLIAEISKIGACTSADLPRKPIFVTIELRSGPLNLWNGLESLSRNGKTWIGAGDHLHKILRELEGCPFSILSEKSLVSGMVQ